jgi:hypothetical protein
VLLLINLLLWLYYRGRIPVPPLDDGTDDTTT